MALLWLCVLASGVLGTSVSLVCPDGGACPDGSTCCKDTLGQFECCPLPKAVCCSDGLHCCPEGSTCDLQHAVCRNKTLSIPWRRSLPPGQVMARERAVQCPDQHSECPDATTCCQLPDGAWGCCPMAKAVCCEDKRHCCPEGTACDLVQYRCVSPGGGAVADWRPLMAKLPARPRASAPSTVDCPDKRSTCPDESTCCKLSSGDYGCCPMHDATCCSDGLHCCPHNTVCNLAAGTCDDPADGSASTRAAPVRATSPPNTKCDTETTCPGTSTCCPNVAGGWACCPLQQAVCCDDGAHCCPHGKRCNLEAETCDDPSGAAPPLRWRAKTPAVIVRPPAVGDIKCDDKSSCAAGTTCCKLPSGEWGCCPLVKAVCCEDHLHCCPQGYSCNMATGTCEKPMKMKPMTKTMVPCDVSAAFACDERETCCRTSAGQWACCPSHQAVCCADMKHCCPTHYSCDPSGGCVRVAPTWARV
ncbi:granulin b isoform X2 [Festucalex cinctus]